MRTPREAGDRSANAHNTRVLARLRADIASFEAGTMGLDGIQAALQSAATVLERDSSASVGAVSTVETEVETIRFTVLHANPRSAVQRALDGLLAVLPRPTRPLAGFQDLAQQLLAGLLSPREFETAFLALRRTANADSSGEAGAALDRLFYVVDDFVADERLREPERGDVDDEQLRANGVFVMTPSRSPANGRWRGRRSSSSPRRGRCWSAVWDEVRLHDRDERCWLYVAST